jgi:hypothetical protein
MTQQTITVTTPAHEGGCDRPTAITKTLLAYGAIAGPMYVAVSLAQALTRDGFDLTRHPWSLLATGDLGWIQIANFALTGLMVIAFAVGLRRGLRAGRGRRWAPRLIGVYGASLVAAGVFRADPAQGFPAGTPADAHDVSWHGALHFAAGGIGFSCLAAACLVLARRFAAENDRRWAAYSAVTGVLFLAGFVGVATGQGSAPTTIAFTVSVVLVWLWISTLAVRLYRRTDR